MEDSIFDNKDSEGIKFDIRSEAYDGKCPYLGMTNDRATSLGFPNGQNKCYRHDEPIEIAIKAQSILCLTSQYEGCAIFQQEAPVIEEKPMTSPAKWAKKARPVAFVIPLILLLIAAFIWWPTPWTTVEDNTSKAAPLQKFTTQKEPTSPIDSQTIEQTTDNSEEHLGDSLSDETADIQPDSSTEEAVSPAATPDDDETESKLPGGFRVRIYE